MGIRAALLDTVVAALPVALVYFAGWAYLSSYLDDFSIDYTQVNIPLTTVLVYAFRPLTSWRVLTFAGVVLLVWQCVALTPSCRKFQARTAVTSGAFVLVALLFLIKSAAEDEAAKMTAFVWKGEKSITNVVLAKTDNPDHGYQAYLQCQKDELLRQIIGFPEQMFVLCLDRKWTEYAVLFVIKPDGTISYYASRSKRHEDA